MRCKRISTIIISALLALTLVGSDAFATPTKSSQAGNTTKATQAGNTSAAAGKTTAPSKTTTKATKAKPKLPKLKKPSKLKAYSGYKCVRLKWNAVPKAEEYLIFRSVAGKKKFKQVGKTKNPNYTDDIKNIYTDYAYRVVATRKFKDKVIKSPPAKIRQNSVRRLRIYVTFKSNKKFSTGTIHKGTTVRTDGYGGGYYVFDHKGKRHTVPRVAVKNASSKYDKYDNYSKKEANLFINDYVRKKKLSTDKKYLVWVSSNTQHLYVFKKKKGKWKVTRSWEVSMGRASTPTSTGHKRIVRKVFSHHNIQFWNCFSGWNAIHGIDGSMGASLGRLASHGCIRSGNSDAAWLYSTCGKGTRIIIY